jgi:hypothetical protein
VKNLKRNGRLHEGTLIGNYYVRTNVLKLLGYIPLGRKMLQTKRIAVFPKRIKARKTLSKIIEKAQEIEMRHAPEPLSYSPEYVGYRGLGELKLEARKGE